MRMLEERQLPLPRVSPVSYQRVPFFLPSLCSAPAPPYLPLCASVSLWQKFPYFIRAIPTPASAGSPSDPLLN